MQPHTVAFLWHCKVLVYVYVFFKEHLISYTMAKVKISSHL